MTKASQWPGPLDHNPCRGTNIAYVQNKTEISRSKAEQQNTKICQKSLLIAGAWSNFSEKEQNYIMKTFDYCYQYLQMKFHWAFGIVCKHMKMFLETS